MMDQKNLTIEWLLDNLDICNNNWDFDSAIKIYRQLCSLDDYYYAKFLVWLSDSALLEEVHALLEEKGVDFFRRLLSDPRHPKRQASGVRVMLNWHARVFLPIIKGKTALHADPYEQTLLALYRDRNFSEMKKFLQANFIPIFRRWKCRKMTSVFAALAIAQYGNFDPPMHRLINGIFPVHLRSRRIIKALQEHLDSPLFFGGDPINMGIIIPLLTKVARNPQCSYQARLLALLYKKLDHALEYQAPLRQVPLEDLYAGATPGILKAIPSSISKGKPRIAICLAGQTRGTSTCLQSLRDNIINPLQADVFLSTWNKVAEWPGVFKSGKFIRRTFGAEAESCFPFPELDHAAKFQATFPNLFSTFSESITKDLDIDFYEENFNLTAYKIEGENDFLQSIPFDIKNLEYRGKHNQAKMFYKNWSVMQLLLEYEKQHDIKYDIIIRMRPDLRYSTVVQRESLDAIEEDTVYLNYDYTGFGPDDNMWVARREAMLKMCAIWPAMLDVENIFIFKNQKHAAHFLTAMWIGKQGLTSKVRTMIDPKGFFFFKDMQQKFSDMEEALEKDLSGLAAEWQSKRQDLMKFVHLLEQKDIAVSHG
jgi:hypothetical protein